jgi:penicillin-binding protein 2
VLGYIKDTDELPEKVNELADLPMDNLQKLQYTGKKGAAGIEQTFDAVLKGMSGWELWTKTSSGYNKELVASNPAQQGSAVNLSLDRDIQCAAERALAQIKDSKGELLPGAAVMLDVNTGEILALASQPTFDPNRLADRVTQVYFDEVDGRGGWMNRAIQGLYAPGSTFKVITAIAGLRHGIVDWDDVLECGPSFRVGGRDFPEHDPAGYGPVDLEKMLAVSCNVWNYMVGVRLGQERLAAEARRFGLDTPLLTHVSDLVNASPYELPYPAARTLVVPDAAYKKRIGAGAWTEGDTANSSIGQGYILTTPLHMACVAASLARGETRTTPSIVHDPGRDGRHVGAEPIGLTEAQLNALRSGLERCVNEGTARSVRIPELPYAAKTGTSEYFKNGEKAHLAWIIGYAPADNPAVAFCVLVEGQLDTSTWGGKTAGPVARDMLTTWARKAEAPSGAQPPSDCQRK